MKSIAAAIAAIPSDPGGLAAGLLGFAVIFVLVAL